MSFTHARPNLFSYANKELEQDAFLCWLVEWADVHNRSEDEILHSAGLHLLNSLLNIHGVPPVKSPEIKIHRQWHHADVVIEVSGGIVLLVEDKVDSKEHKDQLRRYLRKVQEHYRGRIILPVFFKTGDQSNYREAEKDGYKLFLQRELLSVLDHGIGLGVTHPVYIDLRSHLWGKEDNVESFRRKPILEWPGKDVLWIGFFKSLQAAKLGLNWGYVPNASGGFWGAWWGFKKWRGHSVYLQISERTLCFKIAPAAGANHGEIGGLWKEALLEVASSYGTLRVKAPDRFRRGKSMTVAQSKQTDWMASGADGLLELEATISRLTEAERILTAALDC